MHEEFGSKVWTEWRDTKLKNIQGKTDKTKKAMKIAF
jgi:hypothetical protein